DAGAELAILLAPAAMEFVEPAQHVKLLTLLGESELRILKIIDGVLQIGNQGALVSRRQEAGAPERRALSRLRGTDDHEARQILILAAQPKKQPASHARSRKSLLAGVHLQAGAVMVNVVRHHGTDHANVINARA